MTTPARPRTPMARRRKLAFELLLWRASGCRSDVRYREIEAFVAAARAAVKRKRGRWRKPFRYIGDYYRAEVSTFGRIRVSTNSRRHILSTQAGATWDDDAAEVAER